MSQEDRDRVIELKQQGYGKRKIRERTGLPIKQIAKVLREERLTSAPQPSAQSKLDPFEKEIEHRVEQGLTTSRVLREIRGLGYQGGRTILSIRAAELRSKLTQAPAAAVKRRFETAPGEELQIDFSPYSVRVGGKLVRVHAFAVLLCYSRKLYLRFFREERTSTVLEGLTGAFVYFDGVTLRVVMDNMTQAVLGRLGKDRTVLWQQRLLDCARHYGFEPVACAVRDPDRKGKDEKVFRLVWDDLVKGSDFESWEDLERRARIWLDETPETGNLRVHGTTRRVPNQVWEQEERQLLIRLPEASFPSYEPDVREVDRDSTLSVNGSRFTVPSSLANSTVAVHLYADHFEVLDRQQRVAFSRRYASEAQKGKLIIDPTHYAAVPRRPKDQRSGRLDEAFVQRFPGLSALVDGLTRRYKTLGPIQLRALLRLADAYGRDCFLAAAQKAQEYKRYDARAVERILEREYPLPPESDLEAPLGGAGAAVLGEVEAPSLDAYQMLDASNPSSQEPSQEPTPTSPAKDEGGDDHGA
jgi:transposase